MSSTALIIEQTRKWIRDVVIGCNFCPFASREMKRGSIYYEVKTGTGVGDILQALGEACKKLDNDPSIETLLIIMPDAVPSFTAYLDLLALAEKQISRRGYTGTYQLASFHPQYLFAGSTDDDPSNYTNRSPYPMLHLLREDSIDKAIDSYPGTEKIPERNILFAREKGLSYMQALLLACSADT